ncbi:type IV pilus secretin PilQ [Paraburkholderia sp. CNPSo 3157]|uniref:Type IV pilus secretin PilQ n=1 Tax=Paraburkholderia franconis TaxID=2654983 RepID=A0A7X1TJ65_9BURK|nr:type IV pilus secretin PilQ [Paraburkholderia franconis]MPW21225.1 type IV pilus secretin PilQ [Paraburkholderia franconis]
MMRPHNIRWLLACASCVAMAARAALPPLPSNMPFDDAIAPAGMPPLPRVITTDVANPFVLDAADDGGVSTADAKAPPLESERALSAERDDAEPRRKTESEAQKEARQDQQEVRHEAQHEALEGPPVPLAPAARLSTSASDALPADRPITLHFQHAELGAVLGAFARFTGLSIVASEKARGTVTLHLDNVPWRTAFDTLLDVNGLAMEQRGKVIWVAPLSELAARERQRFEAHARAAELEPLASRTFELHYAHADELRKLLAASGNQRVLSKRGAAMADARTNLLFVTDLEARLVQIAELVASLDRPTRQVLIEARIVEAEKGFSRNLGVKLSMAAASEDGKATGLVGGKDGAVFDLSARPISGFDAATAGLTLFAAQATRLLNIELSALEAQGRGQIVSSPRVVTADRMKAIVEQGTELPYQAKVGQGVSGVQFRRASLKLEVEPQITPDGRVVLDLDVAKDSVGEQTASGPAINTKHVQTRVEVEDGGTVSIGGIYEADDRDDVTRVPLLGKIPLLGAFFRHRAHRDLTSELVVFITPRVVQTN